MVLDVVTVALTDTVPVCDLVFVGVPVTDADTELVPDLEAV
jgi:hypothetical protein